ncbi:MAG: hypothetical protein HOV79_32165 [Hamadaea sp.]|nr:hypothetical protein [Hamadaea sp.]
MKALKLAASALAAVAAVLVAAAPAAVATPAATAAYGRPALAELRNLTAKYHDARAAVADGYVPTDVCVESPEGGMGYHFVNPALVMDGIVDFKRPEVVVFVPSPTGLRLGAVEYVQPDADQNLATDDDRPSVFGHPFDGPMPGHEPGMPIHYDLHVWLWKHNPNGLFAAWNPTVHCP